MIHLRKYWNDDNIPSTACKSKIIQGEDKITSLSHEVDCKDCLKEKKREETMETNFIFISHDLKIEGKKKYEVITGKEVLGTVGIFSDGKEKFWEFTNNEEQEWELYLMGKYLMFTVIKISE